MNTPMMKHQNEHNLSLMVVLLLVSFYSLSYKCCIWSKCFHIWFGSIQDLMLSIITYIFYLFSLLSPLLLSPIEFRVCVCVCGFVSWFGFWFGRGFQRIHMKTKPETRDRQNFLRSQFIHLTLSFHEILRELYVICNEVNIVQGVCGKRKK